jgi:hypothetical protein
MSCRQLSDPNISVPEVTFEFELKICMYLCYRIRLILVICDPKAYVSIIAVALEHIFYLNATITTLPGKWNNNAMDENRRLIICEVKHAR